MIKTVKKAWSTNKHEMPYQKGKQWRHVLNSTLHKLIENRRT